MDKLAISGCRDRKVSAAALRRAIGNADLVLVGDCPTGVDACVRGFCTRHGIRCRMFRANWGQYGRAAGPIRNARMIAQADRFVAFWDGRSPGTKSAIAAAKRLGVPYRVVRL